MITENLLDVANKKYLSLLKQVKFYKTYFYIFLIVIVYKRNKNFDHKSKTKIESKDLIIILVRQFIENY
jgi:hypothetical protein